MSPTTPALHGYLPPHPARTYAQVGICIYCGSTAALSDEHIIPFGLGGRFVLRDSSCQTCSAKTSRLERTCLRAMYGPLRLLYGLPSRRKRGRPETLQLKTKRTEASEWEYVPVPQERFPFLVTFPYFQAPGALTDAVESAAAGPVTQRLWIRGASSHHDFDELLQSLAAELGVHTVMPESKAEVPAFCALLAKIALAYLAAETCAVIPNSRLAQIALGANMDNCLHYIGSLATDEPPSGSLHELSLSSSARGNCVVVRVRLLAKLGTPTYFVVLPKKVPAFR